MPNPMSDPVSLLQHLNAIKADLRAMSWRCTPGPPDAAPEHHVVSFSGEHGDGVDRCIVTVVGFTLPHTSRRVDGAHVCIRTGTVTRLTPELADLAYVLASSATAPPTA